MVLEICLCYQLPKRVREIGVFNTIARDYADDDELELRGE